MKTWEIGRHLEQVHKNRELCGGDHVTPVDQMVRPPGIKKYLWEARIRKIKKHEQAATRKLEEGLLAYIKTKKRKK